MQTPEAFIMSHADLRVYDPIKAHEYYLRTRKLKGRTKKSIPVKVSNSDAVSPSFLHPKPKAQGQLVSVIRQKESEARIKARVAELKSKLDVLKAILNQLVKDATKNSTSVKTPKNSEATKSPSEKKDRKALTGAQKVEKAKKAKIQYQKEHPESERQARQRQIKEVQAKIQEVESKLKAALESARKMSTQNTPA